MSKNGARGIIALVILLMVFSIIAFVIPFPKNIVFWIAYIFGVLSILLQLFCFKSSFGKDVVRSRFYGFPIARLGVYYLSSQLVLSIVEIALSRFLPSWVAVIINALILALALIGCITTETMRDEIVQQDVKLKKNVFNMRELQSISATLVDQCTDQELKNRLKILAEEFRYSDPLSSNKTEELEVDMRNRFSDLQQAITDGDIEGADTLCNKLQGCLRERNRVCSINK